MTENLRLRDGDQPLPTEGQESVQDVLIEHIQQRGDLSEQQREALAGEIADRRELGISRYGRALQTFNGRDPIRDLIDELLDGATYAKQIQMEMKALNARIASALAQHQADSTGRCYACGITSPCATRRILTGGPFEALKVKKTEPVEEVAVHPDSLDEFRSRFRVQEAERRLGAPLIPGELFGFPVVMDESIPPGTVRLRPFGFDSHPSHGTKEPS